MLTYSPEDPSLNTAADGVPHNLFGGPGAMLADLAIQALGAAAPLMFAAMLAAGVMRVMRRQLVARIDKRRIGAASGGIVLLAAAATNIPTPEGWSLATGFGRLSLPEPSSILEGESHRSPRQTRENLSPCTSHPAFARRFA